jgi:hypothetical protein
LYSLSSNYFLMPVRVIRIVIRIVRVAFIFIKVLKVNNSNNARIRRNGQASNRLITQGLGGMGRQVTG